MLQRNALHAPMAFTLRKEQVVSIRQAAKINGQPLYG
jgi:hypothetical protein